MDYDDDVYDTFNERLSNMMIYDITDDITDDIADDKSNGSNGSNGKRLFSQNYLHELPHDIQLDIMVLSQKTYCKIVIKCEKHILNFDKSVISKKLNRHMCKFVFTIRDVEYINNRNKKVIERYRGVISNYVEKLQNSLVSHINKFIKHYSINYIRDILYIDDLEEYGSYEKELYTNIILKSYVLKFIEIC
jgi:hypothetical protein